MTPEIKRLTHDRMKGLRESVDCAIQAHKEVLKTQPWLACIGWDMEMTRRGPVFFEGNVGYYRLEQCMFLSWNHLFNAFKVLYWNNPDGYYNE